MRIATMTVLALTSNVGVDYFRSLLWTLLGKVRGEPEVPMLAAQTDLC